MTAKDFIRDVKNLVEEYPEFPLAQEFYEAALREYGSRGYKTREYGSREYKTREYGSREYKTREYGSREYSIKPEKKFLNSSGAEKAKEIFIEETGADPEFVDHLEYIGNRVVLDYDIEKKDINNTFYKRNTVMHYWFKLSLRIGDGIYSVYLDLGYPKQKYIATYIYNGDGKMDYKFDRNKQDKIYDFLREKGINYHTTSSPKFEVDLQNKIYKNTDETELLIR